MLAGYGFADDPDDDMEIGFEVLERSPIVSDLVGLMRPIRSPGVPQPFFISFPTQWLKPNIALELNEGTRCVDGGGRIGLVLCSPFELVAQATLLHDI